MKTLPNGVRVFNATPHPVRFWDKAWPEPVEVASDGIINAEVTEVPVATSGGVEFVTAQFSGTAEGEKVIEAARAADADVLVGSIIAAQAYPGRVVAMVPCDGYRRVPPAQKRVRPDKFTMYG